jgi:hypothetical protein
MSLKSEYESGESGYDGDDGQTADPDFEGAPDQSRGKTASGLDVCQRLEAEGAEPSEGANAIQNRFTERCDKHPREVG